MAGEFVIKINRVEQEMVCYKCSARGPLFLGPQLFFEKGGEDYFLCQNCAQEHAPVLYGLTVLGQNAIFFAMDHFEEMEEEDDLENGMFDEP